ncbi:MAG: hypothetical protein BWX55_00901 [Deltaproteobacteria bacterium ADurb.Bin022]|nr:MAG: hypothetical protein BWX55_00901 [Deltaproteobacteria bacterium ADurb.Bin022]
MIVRYVVSAVMAPNPVTKACLNPEFKPRLTISTFTGPNGAASERPRRIFCSKENSILFLIPQKQRSCHFLVM